jgi:hypothetical protein
MQADRFAYLLSGFFGVMAAKSVSKKPKPQL